jgi:hypothetical protein
VPWIVDDHHTISALDHSTFPSTLVTVQMVCDWSSLNTTDFYAKMEAANFIYLLGRPAGQPTTLPLPVSPSNIPATLASLVDDPFRSLASFARKLTNSSCPKSNKYCMRAYNRPCSVVNDPNAVEFFEFRWGYFINSALLDASLWPSSSLASEFKAAYTKLTYPSSVGKETLTDWENAATFLLYLCRGTSAGNFVFSSSLKAPFAGEQLPGYIAGLAPIPSEDPDCPLPTCPNTGAAALPGISHIS